MLLLNFFYHYHLCGTWGRRGATGVMVRVVRQETKGCICSYSSPHFQHSPTVSSARRQNHKANPLSSSVLQESSNCMQFKSLGHYPHPTTPQISTWEALIMHYLK